MCSGMHHSSRPSPALQRTRASPPSPSFVRQRAGSVHDCRYSPYPDSALLQGSKRTTSGSPLFLPSDNLGRSTVHTVNSPLAGAGTTLSLAMPSPRASIEALDVYRPRSLSLGQISSAMSHPAYTYDYDSRHSTPDSERSSVGDSPGGKSPPIGSVASVACSLDNLASTATGPKKRSAREISKDIFARTWLRQNYVVNPFGAVSRHSMYESYRLVCAENGVMAISASLFGKLLRSHFADVGTRRLGGRGQSRYHYCGIAATTTNERKRLAYLTILEDAQREKDKPRVTKAEDGRSKRRGDFREASLELDMKLEKSSAKTTTLSSFPRHRSPNGLPRFARLPDAQLLAASAYASVTATPIDAPPRHDTEEKDIPFFDSAPPFVSHHYINEQASSQYPASAATGAQAFSQGTSFAWPSTSTSPAGGLRVLPGWHRVSSHQLPTADAVEAWMAHEAFCEQLVGHMEAFDLHSIGLRSMDYWRDLKPATRHALSFPSVLWTLFVQADIMLYGHLLRLLDAHISVSPRPEFRSAVRHLTGTLADQMENSMHGFPPAFVHAKLKIATQVAACLGRLLHIWTSVADFRTLSNLNTDEPDVYSFSIADTSCSTHHMFETPNSKSHPGADFDTSWLRNGTVTTPSFSADNPFSPISPISPISPADVCMSPRTGGAVSTFGMENEFMALEHELKDQRASESFLSPSDFDPLIDEPMRTSALGLHLA